MQIEQALKDWHDFYLLVGTAGATLPGLLFIAVSLGVGFLTAERTAGTRTFMSPIVVHLASVFSLASIAFFPWRRPEVFSTLIGATAMVGVVLSTHITVQVVRTDMTNYMEDYIAYGLLPGLGYLGLLIAAVSICLQNEFELHTFAGALLLLVIVNIRNAWDVTLTMVQRPHKKDS